MTIENPLPLEETDPALAESIRRIVNGEHPKIQSFQCTPKGITLAYHDGGFKQSSVHGSIEVDGKGQRHVVPVERNSPCKCGSGKKYKTCCFLTLKSRV